MYCKQSNACTGIPPPDLAPAQAEDLAKKFVEEMTKVIPNVETNATEVVEEFPEINNNF